MQFKLLDNYTGVLLSRQPEELGKELEISFTDAPHGATAVFTVGPDSYYRELENGKCSIPVGRINGIVKVRVCVFDGSAEPACWVCESLEVRHTSSGTVFALPNDTDMPLKIVELKTENQELRAENKRLWAEITELNRKIEHLYEGYDIV